ncbi:hypothetical protein B0H65DRAFT_510377 [Neurospora tetraspora]|uniref:Uncharacterized protein n=1 Tax=Neurospora tetraspora TaxID=94610 RepID=A0AAE0JAN3_9PEZI|nr:hypothetical protein B0H65DRAFT_510377 [Neurospora tetraspora]
MSDSKFPILRLPAEIRFMIYREIWTLPADLDSDSDGDSDGDSDNDSDSQSDSDSDSNSDSDSEDVDQVNQQLVMITTIQNLAITCRKIREELIDEYFTRILPKTQLHLGSVYPPLRSLYRCRGPAHRPPKLSPLALTNYEIFEVLQSSSLFTDHLQHVSIHWGGCLCFGGSRYQISIRPHGLDWLAELENLKTVEVVLTDDMVACDNCSSKLLMLPRTLEKILFRVFISDVVVEEYEAQLREWFWGQRPSFLAYMAAMEEEEDLDAPDGKEEGIPERKELVSHKIEHHIGAIEVEWPLSDTV